MADYKMVKYCRLCKKRFVLKKGDQINNYCKDCQKIIRRSKNEGKS